jgi:RNA polymerase sigma factor (sigma-70 family)
VPKSGAPTPPATDDFEAWELDLVRAIVAAFLHEQDVFTGNDRLDLFDECLLHWWSMRRAYRADRGASPQTYMRRVVRNKLRDLLAAETAKKRGGSAKPRSLDSSLSGGNEDDDPRTLADQLADLRPEADAEAAANLRDLRARLIRLRQDLPQRERELFDALLLEGNLSAASRRLGRSRPRLYPTLDNIRQMARDRGLDEFLH